MDNNPIILTTNDVNIILSFFESKKISCLDNLRKAVKRFNENPDKQSELNFIQELSVVVHRLKNKTFKNAYNTGLFKDLDNGIVNLIINREIEDLLK